MRASMCLGQLMTGMLLGKMAHGAWHRPGVSISTPHVCPDGWDPMAEIEFGAFPAAKQRLEVVGLFGGILPSAQDCPVVRVLLILGIMPGPSTQSKVWLGPGKAQPVEGHQAAKFNAACAETCTSHLPRQDSEVVGLVSSNQVDEVHDVAKRHPQRRIINKKGSPSRWGGNQPADPMAILVAVVAHIKEFVIVILVAVKMANFSQVHPGKWEQLVQLGIVVVESPQVGWASIFDCLPFLRHEAS